MCGSPCNPSRAVVVFARLGRCETAGRVALLAPVVPLSTQQIWKPLVVCPQRDLSSRLSMAFTELGIASATTLPEYPRPGSLAGLAGQAGCNICFLDVASNVDRKSTRLNSSHLGNLVCR